MKSSRLTAALLVLLTLAGTLLTACQSSLPAETETVTKTAKEATLQEETKAATEEELGYELLPDRLRKADLDALPLATEEMSYADRRQLALDYFLLQLSFHWIPNMDVTDYQMTYGSSTKQISSNAYYGGIPYQSKGTGNLYRWFEYYDEETAVMDLKRAFEENGGYGPGTGAAIIDMKTKNGGLYYKYRSLMAFFNQCSVGSFWGWGRIINSASFNSTANFTFYHGFIPLGYTYPNMETLDFFGVEGPANPTAYDTPDVIRDWNEKNGADGIYKCYAMAKPADLLVSTGHTLMIKEVTLKTKADGSVDYENSYITVQEQTEGWSETGRLHGKSLYYQGEKGKKYTFKKLQSANYIPFTFAEFLDPADPQDKAHLDLYEQYAAKLSPIAKRYSLFTFTNDEILAMTGTGVEKAVVFTNLAEGTETLTVKQLSETNVGSNYPISDVFVILSDKSGKELKKNVYRAEFAEIREMSMKDNNNTWTKDENENYLSMTDGLDAFAGEENTLKITVQLSTGELLTAFEGKLLP